MRYQIFRKGGEEMARTKYAEDAAAMVAHLGEGTTVKVGGSVVWVEGNEKVHAWESYDEAAAVMDRRANGPAVGSLRCQPA